MNDVIALIGTTVTESLAGEQTEAADPEREVFCDIRSVGMRESYAALSVGYTPEIKVWIACHEDYQGEQWVRHDGTIYKVIRTYRNGNGIDLTLARSTIGLTLETG